VKETSHQKPCFEWFNLFEISGIDKLIEIQRLVAGNRERWDCGMNAKGYMVPF
jgi:hypothetical protein